MNLNFPEGFHCPVALRLFTFSLCCAQLYHGHHKLSLADCCVKGHDRGRWFVGQGFMACFNIGLPTQGIDGIINNSFISKFKIINFTAYELQNIWFPFINLSRVEGSLFSLILFISLSCEIKFEHHLQEDNRKVKCIILTKYLALTWLCSLTSWKCFCIPKLNNVIWYYKIWSV